MAKLSTRLDIFHIYMILRVRHAKEMSKPRKGTIMFIKPGRYSWEFLKSVLFEENSIVFFFHLNCSIS